LKGRGVFGTFLSKEELMKRIFCAALVALIAMTAFGQAKKLPDLKGRTVRAVTGNDFPPLNFIDPKTGKAVGWEYDAVNEIGKRVNAKIAWNVSSWDTMIQAIRDGQFDVGWTGSPSRTSARSRWISPTRT
jgi:polar amino acid transport system substrate-binding protein